MKAKNGHFIEEIMVIKLFRSNYAIDLIKKIDLMLSYIIIYSKPIMGQLGFKFSVIARF